MATNVEDLAQLRHLAERQLGVPSTLHRYQWDGVAFLYRSRAALLADEMGLGKTVQTAVALALLLQARNGISRALIVAPASLTVNWMQELATWAPSITALRVLGDARAREAYYLLPIPVLVASYEQIRFDALDRIPANAFDVVVLDEAQRIKNRQSATAVACRLLPRCRAWALSATPLENAETDVASILNFLDGSLGARLSKRLMTDELESRMLRRRKSEVRAELPPIILQDLELPLSDQQRDLYDELWFDRTNALREGGAEDVGAAMLALITRLKILCNFDKVSGASSKLDALRAFVEGAGNTARILVFSQFVETLQWISLRLQLAHDLLTGSMPIDARYKAITEFNEGPAPRALLISLRAGGLGLNLGDATHVVLYDRWWNPAVEMQAIYRAHRFDRDAPLHVVRLLVEDTIEERIAEILGRKERLFGEVVESVETGSYQFTREELMQILELIPEDFPRASTQKEV
ncbi:Non-specific serine/threonine protein kinase [mine drainage metagenome]|uniref:Non-specific serine/threonine protein kinase n=1 Tax=mine drainage metagenome TaxID=410659 RepID=T0ZYD6_9ZZZZ